MTATTARVPGVSFEVVPPALGLRLPRMDVAAFVGFASAGPLHVPVVVEDVARFREIFGPDAALARDPGSGATRHAHLGPAVEEYFRNGGRRCWIVRVADPDRAVRARFPLTGLVDLGTPTGPADHSSSVWREAAAHARAVGGWADHLTVLPQLSTTWLTHDARLDPDTGALTLGPAGTARPGDLLRLSFDGGGTQLLVLVSEVHQSHRVAWRRGWLLRRPLTGTTPEILSARAVTPAGEETLDGDDAPAAPPIAGTADADGRVPLTFAEPPSATVLRVELTGPPPPGPRADHPGALGGVAVLVGPAERVPAAEGGGAEPAVRRLADLWWITAVAPGEETLPEDPPVAERLEIALTVWAGEDLLARLDGLGLDPAHPACWAALPTDEELYGPHGAHQPAQRDRAASAAPVTGGRFPLAGDDGALGPWLPLGVPETVTADHARGPLTDTAAASRLERDGLRDLGADLFLDDTLTDTGAATVVDRALALAALRGPASGLRGLHAVAGLEEVTVVAVPDAVHPGWHEVTDVPPPPPDPPHLWPVDVGADGVRLWWSAVAGAVTYVVEQGTATDLSDARVVLDGVPPLGPSPAPAGAHAAPEGADTAVGLDVPHGDCPGDAAHRVRAVDADGRTGPWSRTVSAVLPPSDFVGCGRGPAVPGLTLTTEPTGAAVLTWEPAGAAQVESSTDPLLARAARLIAPHPGHHAVPAATSADVFHRVRLVDGDRTGGWSVTVRQPARPAAVLVADRPGRGEVLPMTVAVHRSLLRLAAGRGDALAVLTLPEHYRREEALEHVAALTDGAGPVRALGGGEEAVLGYGAVYHPWTVVRSATGVRPVPPDGAVAGVLARRTLDRGAWVSPGHQPLPGVVALAPVLGEDLELLGAGVNLLARRPAGVLALTAHTLGEELVRPIAVRRLLALLRRLALDAGSTFVLEPHDHTFRAMVRRSLESVLSSLYQRGAFAGATPDEAFRVVAGASVNPERDVAAGRFVVELQVAPARPLEFVRVRLVQTGAGPLTATEVG